MPRQVTIARLTVDRPSSFGGMRAINTAAWLDAKAAEIEYEPTLFDLSGWTARRFVGVRGDRTASKLRVGAAGALSLDTRKRIAKWLRSRAKYLRKHWAVAQTSRRGWFTQEFSL